MSLSDSVSTSGQRQNYRTLAQAINHQIFQWTVILLNQSTALYTSAVYIIGWSMSSRPNTPYRPFLCSHYVSKTDMERQAPDTGNKLRIYKTLVLSVLLYASDTWTLLSADVLTLDAFHQKCLRQLLGIRWYNRV